MYSSIASISFAFSLNQTTVARRPCNTTLSPILNLGMLRSSALPSTAGACSLNLSLLDQDRLITHLLAVEHVDRFLNSSVVFELNVPKCRGHAGDKIADDPDGPRFNSAGFHPFLQLAVGAIVGNVNEKQ